MKCCDLTAGMLRNKITTERKTLAPDGIGGHVVTWPVVKSLRAFIKPLTGGESLQANRLESKLSHRVFIRYVSDIETIDRINFNGRYFQIRAIINIEERNRWIELHCEEGVAQ